MNVQLVVFDLDGTLIDSRADLATATNAMLRELGRPPLAEDAIGDMVGDGAGVLVRRALTASGLAEDVPGALDRFLALYDRHLLDSTRPYPGMEVTLEALSRRAILAVLTNKPHAATMRLLAALSLDRYFQGVIGGDTAAGRKPDPTGIRMLMENAGVTPDTTVLVGDSPIDLETARRAGTRLCLVSYGFGYRPVELRPGELLVSSATELRQLF